MSSSCSALLRRSSRLIHIHHRRCKLSTAPESSTHFHNTYSDGSVKARWIAAGIVSSSALALSLYSYSLTSPSIAFADSSAPPPTTALPQFTLHNQNNYESKFLFGEAYRRKIFFNYERRIRMRSPPEKVFEYFASVRANDGEIFMTPADLMRALVPVFPPSESHLVRDGYLRGERSPGELRCAPSQFFMLFDTNSDGLISFKEYLFFVTLLSIPETSFSVAFKMFDIDCDGKTMKKVPRAELEQQHQFRKIDVEQVAEPGKKGWMEEFLKEMRASREGCASPTQSTTDAQQFQPPHVYAEQQGSGFERPPWPSARSSGVSRTSTAPPRLALHPRPKVRGEIDREEFKKVMTLMRAHNRQGAAHSDGLRAGHKLAGSIENGGLLEYFFGEDGKQRLQHDKFVHFFKRLHDEMVTLEFAHYDYKLRGTISAKDFALSMVASADLKHLNKLLDRVDDLDNLPHFGDIRITFEEFRDFAELRRKLQHFSLALFSFGQINGLLTRKDFQRAAGQVCGVSLTDNLIEIIFHVFDTNQDGNLSWREFVRVLHKRERDIGQPTEAGILSFLSCCWHCRNAHSSAGLLS
ncbi:hypothetical protein BUALT_Bualt10G0139900 [Buddleja alternifolia]|uniref:EF-hand domain-containing protein n=1 Tax=Buddleja alternifolia TaxID=168488 RepID=A0AAV6X9K6_9LAMI|nr:hypothetical protein BUALT_Bualt10G0139900 [Buddleja alternifolia]